MAESKKKNLGEAQGPEVQIIRVNEVKIREPNGQSRNFGEALAPAADSADIFSLHVTADKFGDSKVVPTLPPGVKTDSNKKNGEK